LYFNTIWQRSWLYFNTIWQRSSLPNDIFKDPTLLKEPTHQCVSTHCQNIYLRSQLFWWSQLLIVFPLMEEIRLQNIWISRSIGHRDRSFQWRGLRWRSPLIVFPLMEEIRLGNIWISRSIVFHDRSFGWRGLRLLNWKSVWNVEDSRENVFDMYEHSC